VASPLVANVAELLRGTGNRRDLEVTTTVDELGIVDDPRLEAGSPVEVRLHLSSLTDGVVVEGSVSVDWKGTCRRCLVEARGTLAAAVHELYQQQLTDPDASLIIGDQLDLAPLVRELLLLDAPSTPLCRDACAGLCQTCGADLNDGECACAPASGDDRWAELDQLRSALTTEPAE